MTPCSVGFGTATTGRLAWVGAAGGASERVGENRFLLATTPYAPGVVVGADVSLRGSGSVTATRGRSGIGRGGDVTSRTMYATEPAATSRSTKFRSARCLGIRSSPSRERSVQRG